MSRGGSLRNIWCLCPVNFRRSKARGISPRVGVVLWYAGNKLSVSKYFSARDAFYGDSINKQLLFISLTFLLPVRVGHSSQFVTFLEITRYNFNEFLVTKKIKLTVLELPFPNKGIIPEVGNT